jgi:general secretion pathway protein F
MPAFRYEAVDAGGATKKGVLNADSARSARSELRTQGLVPLKVDAIAAQVDAAGVAKSRGFGERLSATELALFTRQLASLLEAGLPLEQAFTALLEQAERPYMRDLIASIRSEVIGGAALSDVLGRHPRDFAEIYRALVASGEQIGQLSRVLSRLADYIERRNALIQKVRLAFTYPAIVTVVAFSIVIFLLTYVVPQIVSVFANTKQKLPILTIIMLAVSDFVRNYGIVVAIALETSRDTLSNVAMQELVEEASDAVREGVSLARALSAQKHFPPMLIHMIRAGEITGELPAMLDRAAAAPESDLERRTLTIAGLLEPALILAMGVVVLLIVLAVLMPIIEINQLVR